MEPMFFISPSGTVLMVWPPSYPLREGCLDDE